MWTIDDPERCGAPKRRVASPIRDVSYADYSGITSEYVFGKRAERLDPFSLHRGLSAANHAREEHIDHHVR